MKKQYSELVKNTGAFAISNFTSKILVFLLVPLYTRVLTTTEYGFYDLTYTTIQLLFPIVTVGITESVMVFLLRTDSDSRKIFTISCLHIMTGTFFLSVLLMINAILNIFPLVEQYQVFILLYFLFYSLHAFLVQFVKGLDKIFEVTIGSLIGTIVMVFLNVLFLLVFKWGLTGYYLANIAGVMLPSLYLIVKLKLINLIDFDIDKVLHLNMLKYSLPLIITTLGWWVNNTSDRYIVAIVSDVQSNGLLSVAYKIPNILSILIGIFIQAWQITVIKEKKTNEDLSSFSNFFSHYNAILILLSSVLLVSTRFIAKFAFGNDFFSAWKFVPFLIISAMFNSLAGYVGAILSSDMNTKALARSAVYGIFANIFLNITLAVLLGVQGITIATMISSFIIYYIREKSLNIEIRGEDYFNILLSWVIIVILSINVVWYQSIYLTIILFLLQFLLYRSSYGKIFQIIKTILGERR